MTCPLGIASFFLNHRGSIVGTPITISCLVGYNRLDSRNCSIEPISHTGKLFVNVLLTSVQENARSIEWKREVSLVDERN